MVGRTPWRSLRVIEHLSTGALIALYVNLRQRQGKPPPWLPTITRWWHARLCHALGVEVKVQGQLEPGCLLVANHISWLDIPVMGRQGEIGFLSKSDVRDWPLIGWMADIAGTLFIARGGNQTAEIAARIVQRLSCGRTLVIFPEGTTTDGREVRRFHPRLFGIAQETHHRIQPVAIAYRRGIDPNPEPEAAYIGDDTLAASLWRIMRHPNLIAEIQFLEPIQAREQDSRRELAGRAHSAITAALGVQVAGSARTASAAPSATLDEMDLDPSPACIP